MNVKILMDSDVELDDERVESRTVRASGKKQRFGGKVEVGAYRKKTRHSLLQLIEPKRILQPTLHVTHED